MLLVSNSRLRLCRRFAAQHRLFSSLQETLKLNVGGQKYTLFRDDIQKYPGSYFATAIKEKPFSNKEFLSINRNGVVFKYINVFLVSGSLPRNASGQINVDQKTLKLLKKEAEFYKLNALKAECDNSMADANAASSVASTVAKVKPQKEIPVTPVDPSAPVVNRLSELWRPIATLAEGPFWSGLKLFRSCSIAEVDAADLISAAKKIAPSQTGPYSVDAFLLSQSALKEIGQDIDVSNLFPDQLVTLRARELKVCTPGCKEGLSADNRHVRIAGTVEVLLKSAFTGGELNIEHDGEAMVLQCEPYSVVATRADTVCTVGPVTSGARVSLIFDVLPVTEVGQSLIVKHGQMGYGCYRYDASLMDDVMVKDFNMSRLIQVAQHLQSQTTDNCSSRLRMDPYFLDTATLTELTKNADLTELFPNKQQDFRVKEILIHDTTSHCACDDHKETVGKGYLGTLVMVLGSYFTGGSVRLSRASERPTTLASERMSWYAYAAGTTHQLHPITHGTRVAVYYDVYSAGDVDKVHDPLEGAVLATVSGTTVTDTLRDQVLTAVKEVLTSADALVITLQDVYPDNVKPDALQGGDRALYDVLTSAADGFADVQLVKVSLQYEYDYALRKNVLKKSTVRNTFGDCSDSAASGTKLVIPTKLPKRHSVSNDKIHDIYDAYTVTGVRVSKG